MRLGCVCNIETVAFINKLSYFRNENHFQVKQYLINFFSLHKDFLLIFLFPELSDFQFTFKRSLQLSIRYWTSYQEA